MTVHQLVDHRMYPRNVHLVIAALELEQRLRQTLSRDQRRMLLAKVQGLRMIEIASEHGVSLSTATRRWRNMQGTLEMLAGEFIQ